MSVGTIWTVGSVARHYGCQDWMVRKLCNLGLVPQPARAGLYRIFSEDDLPKIEAALRARGYLKPTGDDPAPELEGACS